MIDSIFHYDVRLQKVYKLGQGLNPLSDVEGMASFFRENVLGNVQTTDQVLLGKGIYYIEGSSKILKDEDIKSMKSKSAL